MITRGSYVHKPMVKFLESILVLQISPYIDSFTQNNSQGFQNSYKSYEQTPLDNFFHYLPKLYLVLRILFGFSFLSLFFSFSRASFYTISLSDTLITCGAMHKYLPFFNSEFHCSYVHLEPSRKAIISYPSRTRKVLNH